jgi:hypothetical protein
MVFLSHRPTEKVTQIIFKVFCISVKAKFTNNLRPSDVQIVLRFISLAEFIVIILLTLK